MRSPELKVLSLLTLIALLACTAAAQPSHARAVGARVSPIPANTLLIIRAEDERRWDDSLKALLADSDAQVRKRAALAAGRIGNENAVPVLAEMLLTDHDNDVRQMVASALGEIESPGGAYALTEVLKRQGQENGTVRARAVEALGKIVAVMASAPPAADAATKAIDEDRLDILRAAIVGALRFENGRRSRSDQLTILLALTAVLRTKPDGVGKLVAEFLDYSDNRIVADALNTLARLRLKEGNDKARDLLAKHEDPIVRANAARVLGATEDKAAFNVLLDRALHDSDLRVRVSAIRALGQLKELKAASPLVERGILLSRAVGFSESPKLSNDIGVRECDSFIAKYDSCVSNKVPESARPQYQTALEQWRVSWKKLAENPQTTKTLASACKQADSQQAMNLSQYGCGNDLNEVLEIATTTGLLLRNTNDERAVEWLRSIRELDGRTFSPVEVAFARIAPQTYVILTYDLSNNPSSLANGMAEVATNKTGQPLLDASNKEAATNFLRGALECRPPKSARRPAPLRVRPGMTVTMGTRCTPLDTVTVSDFLRAYAAFKPPDLEQRVRQMLSHQDVIVRFTAAELLGEQTPSETNTRVLIEALPRAMRDADNDAALAILSALAKQKNDAANKAIKTALDSRDHLVRRRAVALLKANGVGDFSDRIGTVQTRNTDADYRRAIARIGKKPTATITTTKGSFTIEFLPEDATLNVDNFIQLAKKGYFNGQTIPRVVPNFVVQAGDPRGDQNGGPGYTIRCEINEVPYERATVGMALSGKDTGGSQWFVTHSPQPHLDGGYTVFGHVIRGMEVVDQTARGDRIVRVVVNER
ncbi:MAG TPA: HEAT repeat domain-containing protein [Pyrinomonadaceae bacterium]|nr:HEAT repeat domain-containing protein [Pyrinomonadaceae bacterium]